MMKVLESLAHGTIAKRQSVTVSIAEALREAILKGVLKGGDPLRQDAIAKQFAVSQVTARETFRILAQEGLVEIIPRRGAVVYSLSPSDILEMTDLRALLEVQLIEIAMPHLSTVDYTIAEAIIKQLEESHQMDDFIVLNMLFHQSLYKKADRPRTMAILDRLRINMEPYLRLLWSKTDYKTQSQDDHKEILVLCRAGKVVEVQQCLQLHIKNTGREIEQILNVN
jgi:DNA-binding GntR family transcriptional regulator